MAQRISRITLLVKDQEEAQRYFNAVLGFVVVEDQMIGADKRWLVIAPPGDSSLGIILSLAKGERQITRVGDQTGGKVLLVLHTDDFESDYRRLLENQVRIIRGPVEEPWGKVVVFEDLYGNLWDLVGNRSK